MATTQCPYCEAMNPETEKFCQTCGIPQSTELDDPGHPAPQPTPGSGNPLSYRLEDPTVRRVAVGLAAVMLIALGFVLGRVTGGSSSTEDGVTLASPTATSTTAEPDRTTTTTSAPTTTTATTTSTTTTIPVKYDDVPDDYEFATEIRTLANMGIRVGCNPPANTLYCPNDPMTRGQMASLLVGAVGYTDEGSADLFNDDNGSIFETDIQRVATAGVTKGCNPPDNTEICPDDFVTRGEMAAFLVRALS